METDQLITEQFENNKPVLVFLHYFGGSAQSWKWVAGLLSEQYHCVLIDLPGYGNSPAIPNPSIAAFASYVRQQLQEMQIDSYTLIGHSMGGKIALQLAADVADTRQLTQLILVAPSPPTIERMPEKEQQRVLIHPDKEQAETTLAQSILKELSAEKHMLAVSTQLIADELSWRWWIQEGIHHSIAAAAAEVRIPVTVIASKDDPAVTYQMTMEDTMPNLPPQARLITTGGTGHLFPLEVPEWLCSKVLEILQGE